jgi:topoisomerase (DNA) II binding protein 1
LSATTKEKTEIVIGSAESTSEYGEYIAGDSQTEANDLYLENCKILLAGFQPIEMRKLVNMVRTGGGSRYMSFNDGLTHIVVGRPSEM